MYILALSRVSVGQNKELVVQRLEALCVLKILKEHPLDLVVRQHRPIVLALVESGCLGNFWNINAVQQFGLAALFTDVFVHINCTVFVDVPLLVLDGQLSVVVVFHRVLLLLSRVLADHFLYVLEGGFQVLFPVIGIHWSFISFKIWKKLNFGIQVLIKYIWIHKLFFSS